MARSPADATRFTSTTPHATKPFYPTSSNPGPSTLPSNEAAAAPAGETPQQKVRRLREAANRAREGRLTGFDRVVMTGRVWADRAHRVTALGLIGVTCIAGAVTVYALGDMMIYNRRRRREYFAEQKAINEAATQDAAVALRSGTATAEQLKLLEQQRGQAAVAAEMRQKAQEMREARANAAAAPVAAEKGEGKGIMASATGWLFKGLKTEDRPEVGYGNAVGERGVARAVEARRAEVAATEREREANGGPLDRLGTEEEEEGKGGWTSFMTRK
ncbi:hypothetical protein VC83_07286 [Pseudogymnoascus destructans]|uniref:Uncharacterized protein n=2 Tax=Pseudogymnoascus destructans TaxID=655981 RepID=L8FQN0_PSED2|nr:uncharacterized protein VC83_07286 [Pseudogymnoascus destructans]ELR03280.1 hypothetical protein GMDG_06028 [Pseudogymnoascus destructans 20631-21]OAF56595.1 hypothetical protein VC83_07286 [Pseudogymnoascus destructans]